MALRRNVVSSFTTIARWCNLPMLARIWTERSWMSGSITYSQVTANGAFDFNRAMKAADWDLDFLQLGPDSSSMEAKIFCTENILVQSCCIADPVRQSGMPPKRLISVGIPIEGQTSLVIGTRDVAYEALVSFNTAAGIDAVTGSNYRAYTISISEDRLGKALENYRFCESDISQLNYKLLSFPSFSKLKSLRESLDQLFRDQASCPGTDTDTLEAELCWILADTWFDAAHEHDYSYSARSPRVRRALEFIEAHIKTPFSIEELCSHCAVGRKTLERDFQSQFGLSPRKYIHALRLSGVRNELSANSANVSEVASRWGFNHMSKFAADYKYMFGQLPSETIAQ